MIRPARMLICTMALIVLCACEKSLSEYVPASDEEQEIVGILDQYLAARNSNDVKKLASLFVEKGMYLAGDGNAFKGQDAIANSDPAWWTQYGTQVILNPEFTIGENKAAVSTLGKWGVNFRFPQTFTLVKQDGSWLFTRIAIE